MYSEIDVMDGLIHAYLGDPEDEIVSRDSNAGIEQVISRNHDGRTFMFTVQEVTIDENGVVST